jgi:catechol 2,3-dioxygenase-like lactoylglutathione lyase family enzyme
MAAHERFEGWNAHVQQNHVHDVVRDGPRQALDFYTKTFGFQKRADYPGPEGRFLTITLNAEGPEVLLWPGTAGRPSATPGAPAISVPGPLIIESDDLKKDFETLRSRGVTFADAEPENYPFGMRVTALDPDGNRVSLRQTRKL